MSSGIKHKKTQEKKKQQNNLFMYISVDQYSRKREKNKQPKREIYKIIGIFKIEIMASLIIHQIL